MEDWNVLLVRPGHELRVEYAVINGRGAEAYVPCSREVRYLSDRTKVVRQPLFKGYTFVRGSVQVSGRLVTLPAVIAFLRFGEQLAAVTDAEMNTVRIMAEKSAAVEAWRDLTPGRRIQVLSGPLTGCEGEIVNRKTGSFFTVRLGLLGRQLATPIDLNQTKLGILVDAGRS